MCLKYTELVQMWCNLFNVRMYLAHLFLMQKAINKIK